MRSEQGCFITAFMRLVIIISAAMVFFHGRRSELDEG
jgi:hypothetical protein